MGGLSFPQEEDRELAGRILWFFALLMLGLAALLLRAWNLQISQGAYYLELSENNRLRVVATPPPRGRIYDRHGALLVNNAPSFNLYLVLGDIPELEAVVDYLAGMVEMTPEAVFELIEKRKKSDHYYPIKIKEGLSMREVAVIEGHGLQLPGVKIEAEFRRDAISGSLAAHLLGYVGEVTQVQLKNEKYAELKGGTMIGQFGVEQTYDSILRGTPGEKKIEVDVLGHERQVVKEILPLRGNDIYLALDLDLQKAAEAALLNKPGAIVVLNPSNGDVLAMVSHPAFDPNIMSGGVSTKQWKALIEDKNRPLTNRVIRGQYPPGSTFKVVLSAALLDTNTVTASDTIQCKGSMRFGARDFKDWKKWGHGKTNMHKSLVESCDVYYYEMGLKLGVDTIAKYSRLFGFGEPTGIALAYEKGGLIPTKAWKKEKFKEPWYPGETLSVSIGQGYVSVTPLQLVTMIAAVAGEGIWHTPRLLIKIRDNKTGVFTEVQAPSGRQIPISPASFSTIKKALAGVMTESHGTGRKSRSTLVSIAGKTGTAQVVGRASFEFEDVPDKFADHAWFVAFAPVEKPEIAIVVLVENGGHGGSAAAPLARDVIEAYFNPKKEIPHTVETPEKGPVNMGRNDIKGETHG